MDTTLNARTHLAMNNFETILSLHGNLVDTEKAEIWIQLTNWLNLYSFRPKSNTTVHFRLNYINQRNVIELTHFLKELFKIASRSNLTIIWEYEDENDPLYPLGQDIQWFSELQNVKTLLHNPGFQVQLKNCA
jgi:hypothetical protein